MASHAFDSMTVVDLKAYLRSYGQPISGNKKELLERAQGVRFLGIQTLNDLKSADDSYEKRRRIGMFTTPSGETLPHPSSLRFWTDSIEEIPCINEKDVYNYLVMNKQCTHDQDFMKAYRALKAKVFFMKIDTFIANSNLPTKMFGRQFILFR